MGFAATLSDSDGFLWHGEGAVAETLFHVKENVREAATGSHNIFGRVRAFAGRILAHVNPGGFRCFAPELRGTADSGPRGGRNRATGLRPRRAGRGPGLLLLLLSAPRRRDKSPP